MMSEIKVFSPNESEILAAADIEKRCFPHPWSAEDFKKHKSEGLFLTASIDDMVVGYVSIGTVLDEAYVNTLACDAPYRRRGVGAALLNAACERLSLRGAAFLSLEVRSENIAAIALYESVGFKREGLRRGFYRDPDDDAVIMTVRLSRSAQSSPKD